MSHLNGRDEVCLERTEDLGLPIMFTHFGLHKPFVLLSLQTPFWSFVIRGYVKFYPNCGTDVQSKWNLGRSTLGV